MSRRADNEALLAGLPDLEVELDTIVDDLEQERAGR